MKTFLRVACLALCAAALSGCGVHTVDTGYRGIKVSFGQVEGDPLTEGLYMVNPFTTSIHQMDIRLQKWDVQNEQFLTKDRQKVFVWFTLNYSLDPSAVGLVYKTVGEDWANTLVGQNVHNPLQTIIGTWDAADLVGDLSVVSGKAEQSVQAALGSVHVTGVRLYITKLQFDPTYHEAVERTVIAAQNALAAANQTETIKQQAQQRVISAQAEAQSMKIRADALSQNPKLVEWEAVQKWDGRLPTYSMGGTTPFINMTPGR